MSALRNPWNKHPNMASSSQKAIRYNFENAETELESHASGTAQDSDKEEPDDAVTEPPKRKWTRNMTQSKKNPVVDYTSDEDEGSTYEAEPSAKRVRSKKATDDTDTTPPSCRRCVVGGIECKPNGWHAACQSCRKSRQTCSISKTRRPSSSAEHATRPPAGHQKHKNNSPERSRPLKGPSVFRGVPSHWHQRVSSPVANEALYTQVSTKNLNFQDLLKRFDDQAKRLDDQDKRIQELEAAQTILPKSRATIGYVDKCVKDINSMQEAELDLVRRNVYNRIEKAEDNLRSGLQNVNTRIDQEGHRRKEQLSATEKRCQDNLNEIQSMKRHPKERRDEQEDRHPTAQKFYDDFKLKIRKCSPSTSAEPVAQRGIELQQPMNDASEEKDSEGNESEEKHQCSAILLMENQITAMSDILAAFKSNKLPKLEVKTETENKKEQASTSKASPEQPKSEEER